MHCVTEPEEMSPEERFREVAAILAVGFLRLKKQSGYLAGEQSDACIPVGNQSQVVPYSERKESLKLTEKALDTL